jgi:hypothetical protein
LCHYCYYVKEEGCGGRSKTEKTKRRSQKDGELKIKGRRKVRVIHRNVYRILRKLEEKPKIEGKK